ncbi:MAG: hypothetical protein LBI63_01830 [Candidatus Ancillula sp.]|jgi:hypothetical protein|nr:hypothetical protein [Candidatus Ancillula sp.]
MYDKSKVWTEENQARLMYLSSLPCEEVIAMNADVELTSLRVKRRKTMKYPDRQKHKNCCTECRAKLNVQKKRDVQAELFDWQAAAAGELVM